MEMVEKLERYSHAIEFLQQAEADREGRPHFVLVKEHNGRYWLKDAEGCSYNVKELLMSKKKVEELGYSLDFKGRWVQRRYSPKELELQRMLSDMFDSISKVLERINVDVYEYKN